MGSEARENTRKDAKEVFTRVGVSQQERASVDLEFGGGGVRRMRLFLSL